MTDKDSTFAARQEDRRKQIKIERNRKTERECPRNRKHSLFFYAQIVENHRDSKRAAALLSHARQRSPQKAISSWRLDTTLLCAAKKNGVEKKDSLAGLCQKNTRRLPPRTAITTKASARKPLQSGSAAFSGSGNHVNIRGLFSTSLGSIPFASHQRKNALLRNELRFCIAL